MNKPQPARDPNEAVATESIIKSLQRQRDSNANDVVNVTAQLAVQERRANIAELQLKAASEKLAALEKEVAELKKPPAPTPNGKAPHANDDVPAQV